MSDAAQKVAFSATAPKWLWPAVLVMAGGATGVGVSRATQGPVAAVEAKANVPDTAALEARVLERAAVASKQEADRALADCLRDNQRTREDLNKTLGRLELKVDQLATQQQQLSTDVTALKTEMRLRRR